VLNCDWADIAEIGEDYSIWLRSYERKIHNNMINVKLLVELRTPALLRSGSLITSENINFSFKPVDEWDNINTASEAIKQELLNFSEKVQIEAQVGGEQVLKSIMKMIGKL